MSLHLICSLSSHQQINQTGLRECIAVFRVTFTGDAYAEAAAAAGPDKSHQTRLVIPSLWLWVVSVCVCVCTVRVWVELFNDAL